MNNKNDRKEKLIVGFIVGIIAVLQAIILTLKLYGIIDWLWVFVFFPIIVPVGLFLIFIVFAVTVILLFNPYKEEEYDDK